jgi:hypothetical protein
MEEESKHEVFERAKENDWGMTSGSKLKQNNIQ